MFLFKLGISRHRVIRVYGNWSIYNLLGSERDPKTVWRRRLYSEAKRDEIETRRDEV